MKNKIILILATVAMTSCNYLDVEPIGQVIPHKVSEYRALLTEGYRSFPYNNSKAYTGLLSDEVGYLNEGNLYSDYAAVLPYNYTWQYGAKMYELPYQEYYKAIFQANAIIDGIKEADNDSSEPREEILGEAHALRAYSHFELVNLYGKPYNPESASIDRGVPIYTQIDIEQKFRPATVAAVYQQIIADLDEAARNLTVEKQPDATMNYRFSINALQAFRARVMLYMRNYEEAYKAASAQMAKYALVDLNGLTDKKKLPWTATSDEAIFALERPFGGGGSDLRGASFISDQIIKLFDAENDNRMTYLRKGEVTDSNWEVVYSGYTVDRDSQDRVSIRVAEMYLIAAEAAAHLNGRLADAKTALLTLKAKRLKPTAMEAERTRIEAMNAQQLLTEIADERARELLLEGHRWMDLRRTTQPEIVKTHGGQTYTLRAGDPRYTLPFPQSAVNANPELNN